MSFVMLAIVLPCSDIEVDAETYYIKALNELFRALRPRFCALLRDTKLSWFALR